DSYLMRVGGRVLGLFLVIVTVLIVILTFLYTDRLQQQRDIAIDQLVTIEPTECKYDDPTLCPQADESNIVLPSPVAIGLALIAIMLGIYLYRSDRTQKAILGELKDRKTNLERDEASNLILSVLTEDEKKIIEAVKVQPGITQATLRLRVDMSKAKLSQLLKTLDERSLIKKIEDGKTNTVHLKREI
ncbi:hypothetical protein GOV11_02300, partial [Candidatus Woesearchaeota archaeon]|nr:hypothetical protein [Candidatus Woesearchaeota archaeon]